MDRARTLRFCLAICVASVGCSVPDDTPLAELEAGAPPADEPWAPEPPEPQPGDDRDADGVDDAEDDVIGLDHWVRSESGEILVWHLPDGAIELRLDEVPLARVPTPIDLSSLRIDTLGDDAAHGVSVHAPTPWIELFVPRTEGNDTLCVAVDALGVANASADCEGDGVRRLACPSDEGEPSCVIEEERFVVRGPELRLVWEPGLAIDRTSLGSAPALRPGLPPICIACDLEGSTRSCRLSDGGTGAQQCIEGCWDRCRPVERCNGGDDDADGRVDERGSALCNDRVPCTTDLCLGADGCLNVPNDRLCSDGAECTRELCGRPPRDVPPGTPVLADRNGCFVERRDTFCRDVWDQCACNGAELCDPSGQSAGQLAESRGCVGAPPLQRPCEIHGGDGDACSTENCSEPYAPETCRDHRLLRARIGDGAARALVEAFLPGSLLGASSYEVRTPQGEVQCAGDPFRYTGQTYGQICDDGEICTTHTCTPPGVCTTRRLDGPVPGWDQIVARGCGQQQCVDGRPLVVWHEPDTRDPTQCHGFVQVQDARGFVRTSCVLLDCNDSRHECVEVAPETDPCDDGAFCNGEERCDPETLRGTRLPNSYPTPGLEACVRPLRGACDDGASCTRDSCDEARDTCAHRPDEQHCHERNGVDYDACWPRFVCTPDAPARSGPTARAACRSAATSATTGFSGRATAASTGPSSATRACARIGSSECPACPAERTLSTSSPRANARVRGDA